MCIANCCSNVVGRGIGIPWSELDNTQGSNQVDSPSHVVTPENSKDYMRGFTNHFRQKSMDAEEYGRMRDERYDPSSPDTGILEGNKETGKNCCVRSDNLTESVVGGGVRCASYLCTETYPGECKWRTCAEPFVACMYRTEHRIQVRGEGEHEIPNSILVVGCCMKDAQAEADNECQSVNSLKEA